MEKLRLSEIVAAVDGSFGYFIPYAEKIVLHNLEACSQSSNFCIQR